MRSLTRYTYRQLYTAWAALFAVTALLGLIFPNVSGGWKIPLIALSCLFFLPPFLIVEKAHRQKSFRHSQLVFMLSLLSLSATVALLCVNVLSVGQSQALGNALFAALTIISAPMVCSNFYVIPLFLWGTLMVQAWKKRK